VAPRADVRRGPRPRHRPRAREGHAEPGASRDAALLAVLVGAGIRRAEAVALELADYSTETGELRIRRGKWNRDRIAYATNGARDALADWLEHRGAAPGPLFCPVNKGGRVELRSMTGQAVRLILSKRAAQACIGAATPHDLRRTFVGHLLDKGADISTVQGLAGHTQVTTTAGYDRRPAAVRRKAAELIHVPYRRPHRAA
jgi:site-specific recombinase XerD